MVLLKIASLALWWLLSNGKPLFVLASEQAPNCCGVLKHDACHVLFLLLLCSILHSAARQHA